MHIIGFAQKILLHPILKNANSLKSVNSFWITGKKWLRIRDYKSKINLMMKNLEGYHLTVLMSIIVFTIFGCNSNQEKKVLSAEEILLRSIKSHDPHDNWKNLQKQFFFTLTRVDRVDSTTIALNNTNQIFTHTSNHMTFKMKQNVCDSSVTKINCERQKWLKDYYSYLWGLPMRLKHDLNLLDKKVDTVNFNNTKTMRLKINYKKDVWYYFISLNNFELVGVEFYFDKEEKKGERILFEVNKIINEIKIPNSRVWYNLENNDENFLAKELLYKVTPLN